MKKFTALLALTFCTMISGCSQSAPAKDISIYDLQTSMLAADPDLPDMTTVNSSDSNAEELLSYVSDIDYSKVDGFFISYSSDGKLADEIIVIDLKDPSDADEALASLASHKMHRVALYETYEPSQTSRLESAQVFKNGNYVAFIVSDHSSDVRKAFEDGIL